MEKISCTIQANYDDRHIHGDGCDVAFDKDLDEENIWFNIPIGYEREDDYITVSFRIEDLLSAIGKAISRGVEK